MRHINFEYFSMGGGKQAFRKLPNLLRASTYATDEHDELNKYLEKEATRIRSKPDMLDFNEDDELYTITW